MTGFIVSVFPLRNRVSPKEAFEGLELGEGKPSRPVLRGPGGRKAAWLLGSNASVLADCSRTRLCPLDGIVSRLLAARKLLLAGKWTNCRLFAEVL